MAEILDTEVVLISRKAIAIMTSLFAYIDLFAPMHVSFTMYLLTGSSAVRYGIFFVFLIQIKFYLYQDNFESVQCSDKNYPKKFTLS